MGTTVSGTSMTFNVDICGAAGLRCAVVLTCSLVVVSRRDQLGIDMKSNNASGLGPLVRVHATISCSDCTRN